MKKLLLNLFVLLFLCSCNNTKSKQEQSVLDVQVDITKEKIFKDVSYGTFPRNKLNAFLPAKRNNKTKAIILIPGGGWTNGDKKNFDNVASLFLDSSIATFVMNYRYVNFEKGITYIELLEDIEKVIQFLEENSEEYIFNPNQLCLFGHSAGGHLALLYSYRNNKFKKVDKIVSVASPTDFTDTLLVDTEQDKNLLKALVGNFNINKIKDASPLYHANEITTYLYQGKQDLIVPYKQSEVLFNKIEGKNRRNKYVLFEEDNHGISYDNWVKIVNETVALINNK